LKSEGLEQGIEDQEKAVELAQRLRDFKAWLPGGRRLAEGLEQGYPKSRRRPLSWPLRLRTLRRNVTWEAVVMEGLEQGLSKEQKKAVEWPLQRLRSLKKQWLRRVV
jgi:hypothetical protein